MFVSEARRTFTATGAVAPSSAAVAREITSRVDGRGPLRVLEVGAGTGPFTRRLLAVLPPGSRLDVVESNPSFAARLAPLVAGQDWAHLHTGLVQELDLAPGYDVIVSSLPFTNFPVADVQAIMDRYLELLGADGSLSWIGYLGTARLRSVVTTAAEAARHHQVEQLLAGYRSRHPSTAARVYANLPPATIWHLTAR